MLTRFSLAFIFTLASTALLGQVVNNGQLITVTQNSLLFIDGNYTHKDGAALVDGELRVTGDWLNTSANNALDQRSTGTVNLSGGKQQIGGTQRTSFPKLKLSGTGNKSLSVDVDVAMLALNDMELKLNNFALNVTDASVAAITRSTGFVSTDKKGKLIRRTAGTGPYLFPFGVSLAKQTLYRPVTIEPQSASNNIYSGSLNYYDPSLEGYDRNIKRQDIDKVFDKYFYLLSFESGSGTSNIKFFQNTEEGDFKQIVKWGSPSMWEKAAPSTSTDGAFGDGLNRNLTFTSLDKFSNRAFSFSTAPERIDPLTIFNAFSPDGDGKNDTWIVKNLDIYPNNDLLIFNRWGDQVYKAKSYNSANAWDGGNLQAGTYFYVLNVEINGEKKAYKGFISMAKK